MSQENENGPHQRRSGRSVGTRQFRAFSRAPQMSSGRPARQPKAGGGQRRLQDAGVHDLWWLFHLLCSTAEIPFPCSCYKSVLFHTLSPYFTEEARSRIWQPLTPENISTLTPTSRGLVQQSLGQGFIVRGKS